MSTAEARAVAAILAAALAAHAPAAVAAPRFREVSEAWGLAFRHHHGGSGSYYFVETNSGGVVLFDFDSDGDQDVFFVDGGTLPGYHGEAPRSRLFRNDGGRRFVDWTDASRIAVEAYGAGATAGDVDGDADLDLYVTAYGRDQLWRNEGNGRFTDVTGAAALGDPGYGLSAAFGDADRDGDLDLYVVNYVEAPLEDNRFCGDAARSLRGYCSPTIYPGAADRFYLNRGGEAGGVPRFEEAGPRAGIPPDEGKGMGVLFSDLDDDGWPDLYVTNDTTPNFLFRNLGRPGDPAFEDLSLVSGTAASGEGRIEAGMGVDAGDYDGDGRLDLVVTNFALESNALYRNLGGSVFLDARHVTGLAGPSFHKLGFGVAFADFDHDGDVDLAVANGHVLDRPELFGDPTPYAQRNQVFENVGGRFRDVAESGLDVVRPSRGLATGDLDEDGDLDLVIVNSNQPAEVYENVAEEGAWLGVDLASAAGNRHGVGARLELLAAGSSQVREVRTASSFLSQGALTAHFGVPRSASSRGAADALLVRWPDGHRQRLIGPPPERRLLLVR